MKLKFTTATIDRAILEVFPNAYRDREYVITHLNPEFTSVCPKTGMPDFGTITMEYVPDKVCVELKALKLYYMQYRNYGAFYERVVNMILDDLVAVTLPRRMTVIGEFSVRGGMHSVVHVEYERSARKRKARS